MGVQAYPPQRTTKSWLVGKQQVRNLGPECRLALYGAKSFASHRMFCRFQAMSLRRILKYSFVPQQRLNLCLVGVLDHR
jgi:hypothetical protein